VRKAGKKAKPATADRAKNPATKSIATRANNKADIIAIMKRPKAQPWRRSWLPLAGSPTRYVALSASSADPRSFEVGDFVLCLDSYRLFGKSTSVVRQLFAGIEPSLSCLDL
jgi:hypothetical protein